jgi:NTE family protein
VASSIEKKVKRALVLSGGAARGAFQVGVLRYLERHRWQPDLVCGSSIGAIHAVALGAGLNAAHLERLWRRALPRRLEIFQAAKWLRRFFPPADPFSISDAGPVRRILEQEIDFHSLRNAVTSVRIAAVDLNTSKTLYFTNKEITIDHVMASAAAPVFYPWKMAGGRPCFDGGLMANTPILPALESGAAQIVVVLLSPVTAVEQAPPRSLRKTIETAFELMLAGPFQATIDGYRAAGGTVPEIRLIAPRRMLGFRSLVDYSRRQVDRLMAEGDDAARQVMGVDRGRRSEVRCQRSDVRCRKPHQVLPF